MSLRTTPALLLFLIACGGPQERAAHSVVDEEADEACCLQDRWETPPAEIGQTPPATEAPEDALEPFQPEP